MKQQRIRCVFMRGGTSKALMFLRDDLPARREDWAPIFLSAMGVPDPNGRQLDGMGGGLSSLNKVCVIGRPTRADADVDFTFAQLSVKEAVVDYSGNCGNMSSAIAPFAYDEGLVPRQAGPQAMLRIHNTNTSKIIVSNFTVSEHGAEVDGDLAIDGVAGTGSSIRLDFLDPGGAKTGKLLPSGIAVDMLDIPGAGRIALSMVDAANPCVFVDASTLGMSGTESPEAIESNAALMEKLEAIRRAASVAMGLTKNTDEAGAMPAVPKVALVTSPAEWTTLAGKRLGAADADIVVRMLSVGQAHRAVPLTGALCLAAACNVPGTLPNQLMGKRAPGNHDVRIGHPSGTLKVAADVKEESGGVRVLSSSLYRTARRLFEGSVLYRGT